MHNRREVIRFRPGGDGIALEDRQLLSQVRVNSYIGYEHYLLGRGHSNPYAHYNGAPAVRAATAGSQLNNAFQAGYFDLLGSTQNAATPYLAAVGTANEATARATFNNALTGSLRALTAQLTSQIALLGPVSKSLQASIQQQIFGSASTSLASQFGMLPFPATGTGKDATAFVGRITQMISVTREQTVATLNTFLTQHGLSQKVVPSNVHAATGSTITGQNSNVLQGAFAGAVNDYALGAGPWLSGTVADIATKRAAFDSNTEASVNALAATLTSSLDLTPGASTDLIPTIQSKLLGDGGMLQQLQELVSPTDTSGASAQQFGTDSARIFGVTLNEVNALYLNFLKGKSITPPSNESFNDGFGGGYSGFGNGYISTTTTTAANLVPTYLQQLGFTKSLVGLGANGTPFVFGTTQYGQANGLSMTTGFNLGLNDGLTPATKLNYKQIGKLNKTLF